MLYTVISFVVTFVLLLAKYAKDRTNRDSIDLQRFLLSDSRPLREPIANWPVKNAQKLREHSREFEKQIILIGSSIHVAVGYGLGHCIILEGKTKC